MTPVRGGVLREGYDYDFSRADPATGAHVDPAWCALYETATLANETGALGPMLADTWSVSEDGQTWRFQIRSGARFHSGAACDAEAVAAAYRLHSDPDESPVNAFFWTAVDSIDADGDDVVIRLHHPFAGFPSLLRSWHAAIHHQASRVAAGEDYGFTGADGTGPFRFESIRIGEAQEVRRWDAYPGAIVDWFDNKGPAHLDGVRWIPLLDEDERAAALEEDEVDCVQNPSLLHVERLRENPDLRVIEYQQSSLAYLAVDHETERLGFNDSRVRQALSHAIDRHAIVERDLAGHGWPAFGPIPSQSSWYAEEVEQFNAFNPALTEELLETAGWPRGEDGVRLRFSALVLEDSTLRRAAQSIVGMLANVGVALELKPIQGFASFYSAVGEHPEAFISKWLWPDPVDASIGFISSWSHAGPNWQRASLPAIDDACRAWQQAPDEQSLRKAATEIQLLSAEHLPLIPLYSPTAVWAHHRRVHGWRPTPTNLYPFYNDVWLEPRATGRARSRAAEPPSETP